MARANYEKSLLSLVSVSADIGRMAVPCRTLIVDDDADMAYLASSVLEMAGGLEVAGVAHSGEEALNRFEDAAADVVILDYRMPELNGLEVAARILARWPKQNIVMFSASFEAGTCEEALAIGVRECVSKERVRELPDIVRKWCP